jgi:hypothetical protein
MEASCHRRLDVKLPVEARVIAKSICCQRAESMIGSPAVSRTLNESIATPSARVLR